MSKTDVASTDPSKLAAESASPPTKRLGSLDQFRGYAVAGMFVVNYCGSLHAMPNWIKHHDSYFSYADSIMPAFFFAAGFSYRLTMLRRIPRDGATAAYLHAIWRGLCLVVVSLAMFGFNDSFPEKWDIVDKNHVWDFIAGMFKANLWETLALIGISQIVVLPFIAKRTWVVAAGMLALMLGHMLLSYSFNFAFMYGQPNWMNAYWGIEKQTCWDGGFFGNMTWGAIILGGALAHDFVVGRTPGRATANMLGLGVLFAALGYGLSCLSTLYDVPPDTPSNPRDLAGNPVFPSQAQWRNSSLKLAEPPFVAPPPRNAGDLKKLEEQGQAPSSPRLRPLNYWMISVRMVSMPFALFAIGFSMLTLTLFMVLTDLGGLTIGLFRTFGTNALAAYFLHHSIEVAVHGIVPKKDAPLWWCLVGLVIFYATTYGFVRYLEKQRIFIRL